MAGSPTISRVGPLKMPQANENSGRFQPGRPGGPGRPRRGPDRSRADLSQLILTAAVQTGFADITHRDAAMTSSEFEAELRERGLPAELLEQRCLYASVTSSAVAQPQYRPDGWLCQWVPEGAPPLWRSEAGQPIFSWVPEGSPSVWGSAARHSEQVGRRIPGWTWRGRRSCSSGGSG